VLDAWRAEGLGVAGPEATLQALQFGQVDELLVVAAPAILKPVQRLPDDAGAAPSLTESSSGDGAQRPRRTGVHEEKKPAWETSSPSVEIAPSATPGRLKVAAARTVVGVTRMTAGAVKTPTNAAKKVVGAGARAPATTAKKPARASARTGNAPANTAPPAKRRSRGR